MELRSRHFRKLYKAEMENTQLRSNLKKATLQAVDKRAHSFEEVDFNFLQGEAKKIKLESISRLNDLLSQFEDKALKNGCRIFYAQTPEKANAYILDVAKNHGVKTLVKSKSMVTEEIGLVPFLTKYGIEAIETDLGEYIVQLAGETPSHITTPAIHKSRTEISELFHKKLGTELNNDPAFLTGEARRVLREKFLSADMGISGANFLIAETGDSVIVENEGNARLSTSAVNVHVIVTGIEKVIPKFSDLRIFMRSLGRSSTGQKLTSYVSLIRGPRKNDEMDGPEEVHIVLLDNGRSGLLGTEHQEVLHCIRCGACLNVCPVYRNIGGHAYGSVYPGPIGSLVTPLYFGEQNAPDLPFASSLCGNCTEVCPVGIEIHHQLLALRSEIKSAKKGGFEKFIFRNYRKAMLRPGRYRMMGRMARIFAGTPIMKRFLKGWTSYRELPSFPRKSFRNIYKSGETK
jgi:L-lactate dehydrogenase complex protein LldF